MVLQLHKNHFLVLLELSNPKHPIANKVTPSSAGVQYQGPLSITVSMTGLRLATLKSVTPWLILVDCLLASVCLDFEIPSELPSIRNRLREPNSRRKHSNHLINPRFYSLAISFIRFKDIFIILYSLIFF